MFARAPSAVRPGLASVHGQPVRPAGGGGKLDKSVIGGTGDGLLALNKGVGEVMGGVWVQAAQRLGRAWRSNRSRSFRLIFFGWVDEFRICQNAVTNHIQPPAAAGL